MSKINIIHCADLHLGMHYCGHNEKGALRNAEILTTFNKIISMCIENNTDILLISGDLFDRCETGRSEAFEVINMLTTLKNTRVFIAPGNHDFVNLNSPYELYDWPENVYIFRGGPETVFLKELNATVTGAAFVTRHHESSFIKEIKKLPKDTVNLGIFHGEIVNSAGQGSHYAPFYPKDLEKKGFDYVALGHIHAASPVLRQDDTYYAYCGTPDGHGFDETGEKGVYAGDVWKGGNNLTFTVTCSRSFWQLEVDVSECRTALEVAEHIRAFLSSKFDAYEKNFYDITLTGTPSENLIINTAAITAFLTEIHYIKLEDETHLAENLEEIAKEKSVRGIFTENMCTLIKQYEADKDDEMKIICEKARDLCLKAFREKKLK